MRSISGETGLDMNPKEFRRALTSPNISDRIRALRTYTTLTDDDIPHIEKAIWCHNPKLHMSALDAIEPLPFSKTKKLLATLVVFGASPGVRARAVRFAARTQYDDATCIILQAARDTAYEVQVAAIQSLAGRKKSKVRRFLLEKLNNPGLDLHSLPPKKRQQVQIAVLRSLGPLGYARAIPVLVDIFVTEPALRQAARDALLALRTKRVSSVILDRMHQLHAGDAALRLDATELITHCGLPATKSELYDELLLIQYKASIASGEPPELVRNELIKSASPRVVGTLAHLLQHHAATPEGQPVAERILSNLHAMLPSRTLDTLISLLASPHGYIQQPTIDRLVHACKADPKFLPKVLGVGLEYPDAKLHQHLPHILKATLTSRNLVVPAKTICTSYLKAKARDRARYEAYVLIICSQAGSFGEIFFNFFLQAYLAGNWKRQQHLTQLLYRAWREIPRLGIIGFLISKHLGYRIPKRKAAVKNMLRALLQHGTEDDRLIQDLLTYAHHHSNAWNLVHDLLQSLPADRRCAQLIVFLSTTFDLNMLIALVDEGVEQARDLVHQYLDDPTIQLSDAERQQVVSLLEKVGNQSSTEPLTCEAQRRECPKARIEATRLLGVLGDDSAAPALIELLEDTRAGVVKQAVISLGQIAHFSAIPHLEERREKDPNKAVKQQARRSLEQIFERYQVELAAKAEADAGEDTIHLIVIFESLGDERAVPLLLARLEASHDPRLTIAIARALRSTKRPEDSVPALKRRLDFERNAEARLEIENAIDYLLGSETFEIFRLVSQVCDRPVERDAVLSGHKLEDLISEPQQITSLRDALAAAYRKKDAPDSFVAHLDAAGDVLVQEVIRASGKDPEGKVQPHANRINYVAQIDNVISSTARDIHDIRVESHIHHPADERTGKPKRQLKPEDADATQRAFRTLFVTSLERLIEYRVNLGPSRPRNT